MIMANIYVVLIFCSMCPPAAFACESLGNLCGKQSQTNQTKTSTESETPTNRRPVSQSGKNQPAPQVGTEHSPGAPSPGKSNSSPANNPPSKKTPSSESQPPKSQAASEEVTEASPPLDPVEAFQKKCQGVSDTIDVGNFDVLQLKEGGKTNILPCITYKALQENDLFNRLSIDKEVIINALMKLDKNYYNDISVTFHNSIHAADTVQAVYYLHKNQEKFNSNAHALLIYTVLIAAASICAGHPGFTNAYILQHTTEFPWAAGKSSPLEEYRLEIVLQLFKSTVKESEQATFENTIKELMKGIEPQNTQSNFVKSLITYYATSPKQGGDLGDDLRLRILKVMLALAKESYTARPADAFQKMMKNKREELFKEGDLMPQPVADPKFDRTAAYNAAEKSFVKWCGGRYNEWKNWAGGNIDQMTANLGANRASYSKATSD